MTSAASLLPPALLPPLHVPQPGTPAGAEDLILPHANEEVLAPRTLPHPLGLGGEPPELEIEGVQEAAERKHRPKPDARGTGAQMDPAEPRLQRLGEVRPCGRCGPALLERIHDPDPSGQFPQALAGVVEVRRHVCRSSRPS
jgi:hypothetical protein